MIVPGWPRMWRHMLGCMPTYPLFPLHKREVLFRPGVRVAKTDTWRIRYGADACFVSYSNPPAAWVEPMR